MPYEEDDWCVEEERKYIFGGSCEVYMPPGLIVLHKKLIDDLIKESIIREKHLLYTEYDEGWNDALECAIDIINKRFGVNL